MKKFIIFGILFAIGFCSCYKDKGNYDYDEIFEITIDSLQESYHCYALIDTLRIAPEIYPQNVEYEYWWGVYENIEGMGIAPKLDTICYTCHLEYPISLAPGNYGLIFSAKEKTTGIAQIVDCSLTVETALSTGWYVLRTQDGVTDLDLFTATDKIENVIASNNNGKNLKGEACALSHISAYRAWDEGTSSYANTNTLFALSDEDMVAIRIHDGIVVRTFDELFYEVPTVAAPSDIFGGLIDIYAINAGKIYTIYNMMVNSGRFGEPKAGSYELSSFRVHNDMMGPLLYDKNTSSFCTADAYSNELFLFSDDGPIDSISLPSVNQMNADLLFMGPTSNNCAYALMKKKQEDMYLMLNLNANCTSPYKNPIQTCDTLDNNLGILNADKWATNLSNHIIYYAQGNSIYSCNIDGGYQERQQVMLPVDENITYMRHLVYNDYDNMENSFDYIAVASYDGNDYKVYLYRLQAGNLQPDPQILEGKGKVGALIYIAGTKGTALR